jgi:hypothetical protein
VLLPYDGNLATSSRTERYRPLPNYDQRFVFLTTIQLPIMRAYYDRITSSLDAYETLSSAFIRAVPGALAAQVGVGADVRRLTLGVDGISRLVKALLSATWLRDAMEHWGDDIVGPFICSLLTITLFTLPESFSWIYGHIFERIRHFLLR